MRAIESKDNPLYKTLLAVKTARQAKKRQQVVLEGPRHVADLAAAGLRPHYLFFSQDDKGDKAAQGLLGPGGVFEGKMEADRLILLPPSLFHQASSQKTDQGVLALAPLPDLDLEDWLDRNHGGEGVCRLLILEKVQDPGNVGSLIRTADALAWQGVILAEDSASLYNPKTLAASMGSVFHLPVFELKEDLTAYLTQLKSRSFKVLGAALEGKEGIGEKDLDGRLALILGNEGQGLSAQAMAAADLLIRIPMKGRAQSLNVAAAGAILLWEAVRGS